MKVLIVDDEEEMLDTMCRLLSSLGYEPTAFASGVEALSRFDELAPDVVILDRNMPEMDGVTCAIKLLDRNPEAKVVLISGYDQDGPDGIQGEIRSLISGYLTKPLDIMELSNLLARLTGNKS